MRRKNATIKLNILPNKIKDGKVPVVIQCFFKNKQKTKYCDVWIDPKNWDKINQRITAKEPNSTALNKILQAQKTPLMERLDYFVSNNIEYDLDALFDTQNDVKKPNSLRSIADRYFRENLSKENTKKLYESTIRNIEKFKGEEVYLDDITKDFLLSWREWMLEERELKPNSVRNFFALIQSLMNWCSNNDIIVANGNPFLTNNFVKNLPAKTIKKALSEEQLEVLIEYFFSFYDIDFISGNYAIKQEQKYFIRHNEGLFFTLRFFLVGYYLQGLAPIDVFLLKKSQFQNVYNEKTESYYWRLNDVYRRKTDVKVVISVKRSMLVNMLFDEWLSAEGEYFVPFCNNKDNCTDQKIKQRVSNMNISLKKLIHYINEYIDELKRDVEKLNPKEITMYSYRHTFASLYVKRSKNINLQRLGSMMGRDINGIATYIKNFTDFDDVTIDKDDVFGDDY